MSPAPFLRLRWQGRIPLAVLLWRDMLWSGTLINVLASFLALAALALGAHGGLAVALHLSPVPYNVFLLAALLRLKDGNAFTTSVAFAWFIVVLVL
jgi:hypothetical protein